MKTILVTGSNGFIGKNLIVSLKRKEDIQIIEYDLESPENILEEGLAKADLIYHLAGVNRPKRVEEFTEGNVDLINQICETLKKLNRKPQIILSSSTQATLDNPYGLSKRQAEEVLLNFSKTTGTSAFIFRLNGVFGKWCKPNYNSVVATFCNNIARNLPISISEPKKEIELIYIDDVIRTFIDIIDNNFPVSDGAYVTVKPAYQIAIGELAEMIQGFHDSRETLELQEMGNSFTRALYGTYISYLPKDSFSYDLTKNSDSRGDLAELLKSISIGQIFVSRTRPGFTRGNHYHNTKVEKFVVLEGDAIIRFRHILEKDIIEYPVSGYEFRVVDIPPGYTHSIENIGSNDLIVLFWADEIFDPDIPDTIGMTV